MDGFSRAREEPPDRTGPAPGRLCDSTSAGEASFSGMGEREEPAGRTGERVEGSLAGAGESPAPVERSFAGTNEPAQAVEGTFAGTGESGDPGAVTFAGTWERARAGERSIHGTCTLARAAGVCVEHVGPSSARRSPSARPGTACFAGIEQRAPRVRPVAEPVSMLADRVSLLAAPAGRPPGPQGTRNEAGSLQSTYPSLRSARTWKRYGVLGVSPVTTVLDWMVTASSSHVVPSFEERHA